MVKTGFSRKDALLWCWKNIRFINNNIIYTEVQSTIGTQITDELLNMGFIASRLNNFHNYSEFYMTDLGRRYCEELFED